MQQHMITLEIDPRDYGFGDVLDVDDAQHFIRLLNLGEEAARQLRGTPLGLALREAVDRCERSRKRLDDLISSER